jgi:hypothetical protein
MSVQIITDDEKHIGFLIGRMVNAVDAKEYQ